MALTPVTPMKATLAAALPIGDGWSYEIKWDGYRAILLKEASRTRLLSRNLKDLTPDYPRIAAAAAELTPEPVMLDGELVALDARGVPSFQALQHRATSRLAVVFYAFDLLQLGAVSYLRRPLRERRRVLRTLRFAAPILLSTPLPGLPSAIEAAVRGAGLEGVIAKRDDSLYEAGNRSDAWRKVKFSRRQEFVIGGYQPAAATFDSVLVGFYEGGRFLCAGKVRAGFTAHTRAALFRRIAPLETARCPFVNLPNSKKKSHWGEGITLDDMATLRWIKPRVIVEVAFTEWTAGGNLRHAAYVGERDDKQPRDVGRLA